MTDISEYGPTVADVIARIDGDRDLSGTKRRDACSALRRMCRALDRDAERTPADITMLRAGIRKVLPERAGLSRKNWQNIRSGALAAIRHAMSGDSTARNKRSAAWRELGARLPGRRMQAGLSRLTGYCSARRIEPGDVSDDVIAGFIDWVRNYTFVEKPNDLHRRTCRLWNEGVETVDGWPQNLVSIPNFRAPRKSIPLTGFTVSFQKDVRAHGDWLAGKDLFAAHPPPKVCKQSTIELREKHIVIAASALVVRGTPVASLHSLADLVMPDAVKEVLRHCLEGRNNEPSQFLRDLAKSLILVARHWVRVDDAQLALLKDLRKRLGPDRAGLTEKNRATLRQFDDDRNKALLLNLPGQIVAGASGSDPSDRRSAVSVQIALAIELLTMAPMRMGNLIGLRLDRHVIRPRGKHGAVHLVIPGSETKAGEEVEYPLPKESADLLDLYLREYRPRVCPETDPWLFVRTGGGRKAQATMSQQIAETILHRTGITITVHQFRHLAAKLALEHEPGNFEGVRQLLGHRNIKSTTNFYTGLRTASAARHYDGFLGKERERLAEAANRKPPR